MADKKPDGKKEKDPFADSSEIFESIFKEATSEIEKETGKVVSRPSLKPKAKPEVKPKPEAKPKAPTKLELEPKSEPKAEPEHKQRPEAKPRIQTPSFRPRQEPVRKPITRTTGSDEEETATPLLSTRPIARNPIREQKPKDEPGERIKKPKSLKEKSKGSPALKIILLLVLLAVGVGGASVYLGIIDLSDYIGWPEPAKKEPPKVAATKPSPAQPAAKTPQQAAPKPGQPSQPQAKPSEAPKAPAPPQTAQTTQPPAKPTEPAPSPAVKEAQAPAVKPQPQAEPAKPLSPPPSVVPPQPSPEVQAKPEPPAPPAAAKVETPPPPAQPPAKLEPPPVQPTVKTQPQASPQPVQPPVKSEPKSPPAQVQPPAASKKVEIPQPASQAKEAAVAKTIAPVSAGGVGYSYSVYLGSVQGMDFVKKAVSSYEAQGLSIYWSKVDLGAKGTWYRLFTGCFRSAQEAEAFIQQMRIKDGEVKETRYTNLIGTFGGKLAGDEKILALAITGVSAYSIQAADGQVRVYSGAFITKEGAEKNQTELKAKGIQSEIVER